jgi:DNA-directed RNA polymerase subunit RPC12/RpoP
MMGDAVATLYKCDKCGAWVIGINYANYSGNTTSAILRHDRVEYYKDDSYVKKLFPDSFKAEIPEDNKDLIFTGGNPIKCHLCGSHLVHEINETSVMAINQTTSTVERGTSTEMYRVYCPNCNSDWTRFVGVKDMRYYLKGPDLDETEKVEEDNPFMVRRTR